MLWNNVLFNFVVYIIRVSKYFKILGLLKICVEYEIV